MYFQSDCSQIVLKPKNSENLKEYEIDDWQNDKQGLTTTIIQIEFTDDHKIVYLQNGIILRMQIINKPSEQYYDDSKVPDILRNMEQIKYLFWQGQYGLNRMKIGKWIAFWNGYDLQKGNGYYLNGQKQGFWKEPIKSHQSQAEGFVFGEYFHDFRISKWTYIYQNNRLDGGFYNEKGKKIGQWIEFSEKFWDKAQVIYNGEYDKMTNKKAGIWNILYKEYEQKEYKQIGGGSYDNFSGCKIGRWEELLENFQDSAQVTYNGEYNIKGMKIGRWDIKYEGQLIGGGYYDNQQGNKVGMWCELYEKFDYDHQITYNGQYDLKSKKVGRWDIMYQDSWDKDYKQIGGGSYDNQTGNKIGMWCDLYEKFDYFHQIIYNGQYNRKGIKVDRWSIMFKFSLDKEYQQIGGGSYDNFSGIKIGRWIELWDNTQTSCKITYNGEYNRKGMKVERWDIKYDGKLIGGGSYDAQSGQKIGIWCELYEKFDNDHQITYNGQYNMKGIKVDKWSIRYDFFGTGIYKQIGGGLYEIYSGLKVGSWIELDDDFRRYNQIALNGEYNGEGTKVGKWKKIDLRKDQI